MYLTIIKDIRTKKIEALRVKTGLNMNKRENKKIATTTLVKNCNKTTYAYAFNSFDFVIVFIKSFELSVINFCHGIFVYISIKERDF